MTYQPGAPKFRALVGASLVATIGTVNLAMLAAFVEDLPSTFRSSEQILSGVAQGILGVIPLSALAVMFGFVGALAFLGVALVPLGRCRRWRTYALTGALTGLVHSICGLVLHIAIKAEGYPRSPILDWLSIFGGFFLTDSPRQIVVLATFPASIISGAVAGYCYARIIGAPVIADDGG